MWRRKVFSLCVRACECVSGRMYACACAWICVFDTSIQIGAKKLTNVIVVFVNFVLF